MAINDKRQEAIKRLKAVQNKINRLSREKGVKIAGTQYDVRVDRDRIGKMRSRELDRFISRANAFVDRRNQFVALRNGIPAPASTANRLMKAEARYNQWGQEIMGQIGGLQAPFSGMSIAERDAQMRPTVKAGGEAVSRTFEPVKTDLSRLESVRALDMLTERREKQSEPTYAQDRVNRARGELDRMLTRIGDDYFRNEVNKLTDEQFFVFWEYGPYAGDIALQYDIIKAQEEQNQYNDNDDQILDDISVELNEVIQWAQTLPSDVNLGKREAKKRSRSQGR